MQKKIIGLIAGSLVILAVAVCLAADGDVIVNGNAGIGTMNPTERLEVNGNVKATGLLAPGVIAQIQSVSPTADTNTNSTSFVDMNGMTITLTTAANSKLLIFWNAGILRSSFNQWAVTEAQVDGNRVGAAQGGVYSNSATVDSVGGHAVATVGAGSHTVKIRWRVTGATATNNPTTSPDQYGRTLTVIEVRQ